jgi:hypothetical protein
LKKRKTLITVLAICSVLAIGAVATFAYITAISQTLENTFTYGDVSITLEESPVKEYLLLPGAEITKDPTITVKGGSDACWLFFKAEPSSDFSKYMTYTPAEGWKALSGASGVYYRIAEATKTDVSYGIIEGNRVAVHDTVTEEELELIRIKPTLTFTAYAVQFAEIDTAEEAWNILKEEQLNEAA